MLALFEPVEKSEVALVRERRDCLRVRVRSFLLERRHQLTGGLAFRPQRRDVALEMLDEDVEVARRTERRAEPAELGAEPLRPVGIEDRASRAEKRARAAGSDAQLVKVLGIPTEPGS